jgi:short-subunit dehydrogenase
MIIIIYSDDAGAKRGPCGDRDRRCVMVQRRALFGPWAIVTGASDGIGRATARELARDGFKLVLVARRRAALEALARELSSTEVIVIDADLATAEGVERVVRETEALDVGLLIAAAGFGTSGPFLQQPIDDELSMIMVNCRAVASLTHAVGRRLVARGRGGIVLYSSLVAFQGVKNAANYAATKAWAQSFAEGLELELREHGVRVLACAPGPVASGFGARARMRMGRTVSAETVARESLAALHRGGTVRPGWLSRLLEWSLSMLPRWGRVRVLSTVMGGMTRHQLAASQPSE